MPICIHCSTSIDSLYMRYGKDHIVLSPCTSSICSPSSSAFSSTSASNRIGARKDNTLIKSDEDGKHAADDIRGHGVQRGSGRGVILADGYLEHDLTIVILDLILAKPQAYRHLLFNRSSIFSPHPSADTHRKQAADGGPTKEGKTHRRDGGEEWRWWLWWRRELWQLAKKFLALSLVDAYIRWFYLCVQPPSLSSPSAAFSHGVGTVAASSSAQKLLSGRSVTVMHEYLPIQAGMFFPSLFTPRANPTSTQYDSSSYPAVDQFGGGGNAGRGEDVAIGAVCSAVPIWQAHSHTAGMIGETVDSMLPTLVSYINVLIVTLIEALALHVCVGFLTYMLVAFRRTPARTLKADPLLASKALLLSQLSPLILLTFVLLWSTKFPHHHRHHHHDDRHLSTLSSSDANDGANLHVDRGWMIWIIRTFLASLNAGVAIGTILPPTTTETKIEIVKGKTDPKPPKAQNNSSENLTSTTITRNSTRWWPPLILGSGWIVQSLVSLMLYKYLS